MTEVRLTEEERFEIGQKLGAAIQLQIEVIAALEQMEPWQVFDQIVESYVAERIINEGQADQS